MTPPPPPVFHRASAPSPPSPEPVLPDEESRDELDFLGNDPFGATLAEVEALYLAAGEDLSASDEQFRFRRPTLATTAKRCVTRTPSAGVSASTTSSHLFKTSTTSSTRRSQQGAA